MRDMIAMKLDLDEGVAGSPASAEVELIGFPPEMGGRTQLRRVGISSTVRSWYRSAR
jgi:hypothetical protein